MAHDPEHDHPHVHGPDCAHDHDHSDDDHAGHDHAHEAEETPDLSEWAATTQKHTCPDCGEVGAVSLGGGIFCPACGAVTTNVGYQAPPAS